MLMPVHFAKTGRALGISWPIGTSCGCPGSVLEALQRMSGLCCRFQQRKQKSIDLAHPNHEGSRFSACASGVQCFDRGWVEAETMKYLGAGKKHPRAQRLLRRNSQNIRCLLQTEHFGLQDFVGKAQQQVQSPLQRRQGSTYSQAVFVELVCA